jgi:DNA (cytosine-5)-methyltransferase 1
MTEFTVGSMFSGIGGLDLGLEWAGMRVIWQAENQPYCCRVLARHWPHVPNHGDVSLIDWRYVERPNLIAGGYPCQPFSQAGKRQGENDPRHVWPYMANALRHLRPTWALLENVPGHRSLGFGEVLADLARLGYDAQWESVSAAAFGAPHLRWRVFIVAYTDPSRWGERSGQQRPAWRDQSANGSAATLADPDGKQLRVSTGSVPTAPRAQQGQAQERQRLRSNARNGSSTVADTTGTGRPDRRQWSDQTNGHATTKRSSQRRRPDWSVEPNVGRMVNGLPNRVDRIRGLGNAVVPQVAEWFGQQIMAAEAARLHLLDVCGTGLTT